MFDRIVLLNLDKRRDRLGAFKAKIRSIPSLQNYTRYRAILGEATTIPGHFVSGAGAWGCARSHLRILEDAMMDNISTLLVLEDDVRFCPNFDTKLRQFMEMLPADWEGLLIGGQNMTDPKPIGIDGIARATNTQRTHAYAIRGLEPMRSLYRIWCRADRHIDHFFGQWQAQHNVYQPDPFLCGQDETTSDITGRQDVIRWWSPAKMEDLKDTPLILLDCERSIAESLRTIGFHFGYSRDPITGKDKGLQRIETTDWPQAALAHWGDIIVREAADKEGCIAGIWHHPHPATAELEAKLGRKIQEMKVVSVEDAVQKMPSLVGNWKARQIVWCWRGEGWEILEGMAYHGWHRGWWRDEVTGLDNSIRQIVDKGEYPRIKGVIEQLTREVEKVWFGKVLLAHPDLDVDRVRAELLEGGRDVRELVGENIGELIDNFERTLAAALEMYRQ